MRQGRAGQGTAWQGPAWRGEARQGLITLVAHRRARHDEAN